MSNETRTMLVVLLVCGFVMGGCILVPLGVGAVFFLKASQQAQAAQVQAERALAAEQQARAQAELARAQAQAQQPTVIPGMPPLPSDPQSLQPAGVTAPNIENIEWRKQIYLSFKLLRTADEEMKKTAATDDPTVALIASALNQQKETLLKGAGLTPEQVNQILAEGDKAGW
jgi:type II secretory pathway pseudopilin PulG